MRPLFTLLLITLLCTCASAQESANWLRHGAISPDGDQVAFTYKGDLYTVSSNGGRAQQLTFHKAHDYAATWSKDGKQLAFASNRYGNFDVFTMPAQGGPATRLTFHSNNEKPYTFAPDGKAVVFGALRQDDVKHRQFPHRSQSELYSVPVSGGRVNQILTVPAEYVQFSPDGKSLYYQDKKGGEDEYRKHHTSSITRDLWRYDIANKTHTQLTTHISEDRQPIVSADGKTIYFLSERSGTYNVWKAPAGVLKEATQVTDFKLPPARFLSQSKDGTL
jgi:Tol biopolymer transport system component